MLAELVALAVPPRCAACREPGRRAADVLCGACRRALPWLAQPCCPRCALPLPCGRRCPARDAPFDAAWSAVAYEGTARDAMHALKFSAARPLAGIMAAQIATNAPRALLVSASPAAAGRPTGLPRARDAARIVVDPFAPGTMIVAVPAHPARRRARGFDPAELLAQALARRTGLPLAPALRRSGAPSRQLGASGEQRRAAGRLRFSARSAAAPPIVTLVDDVHTTGATLAACAAALKAAGTQRVVVVSWARTR